MYNCQLHGSALWGMKPFICTQQLKVGYHNNIIGVPLCIFVLKLTLYQPMMHIILCIMGILTSSIMP